MPSTTESASPSDESDTACASAGEAVERCIDAWNKAFQAQFAKTKLDWEAKIAAAEAYRLAMPTLSSENSIQEFIACVTHGILLGAFEEKQASQLLYAAQVASCALTRARKSHARKDFRPRKGAT